MPKSVHTDAYAAFLAILVATRRRLGISQVELARRLGKPQPFVSYFERGERRLDVVEFYAVATALGVDPKRLFSEVADQLPGEVRI
jgi:transcriptional regulator with XRE-family HTH domain